MKRTVEEYEALDEAIYRAIVAEGVEPGSVTEYSDALLMLLLMAFAPEKYGAPADLPLKEINAAAKDVLARLIQCEKLRRQGRPGLTTQP